MNYQVLARKWRPRTFAEVAGQAHVLRALINALDNDRLHHAYLFTGTRGVGKTTLARIFAKALNCQQGPCSEPCGQCSACQEIDSGRFIDLIEVDAASRTKVEDTRELLDNVQYAPVSGRFKIYIIDEVHMLSKHSFNALLKTLEEPPPYVKFLLATTDPQKLPVTVLSRCLQFNLRRLPVPMIRDYLQRLMKEEGIEAELPALLAIARAADGSMRDALSLLDQAISFGSGQLLARDVDDMLGTINDGSLEALLLALAEDDGAGLLAAVDEMAMRTDDFSDDYTAVLDALLVLLHRIALAQAVAGSVDDLDNRALVLTLAEKFSPEAVQLYYQIALIGRRDLALAPDPRLGLEMVLLRMLAFRPQQPATESMAAISRQRSSGSAVARERAETKPTPATAQNTSTSVAARPPAAPSAGQGRQADSGDAPAGASEWEQWLAALSLTGMTRMLAINCSLQRYEQDVVELTLDEGHAHLRNDAVEERLAAALSRHLGKKIRLTVQCGSPPGETPAAGQERLRSQRQQAAAEAISQDHAVQMLQETFSARILEESITPLED